VPRLMPAHHRNAIADRWPCLSVRVFRLDGEPKRCRRASRSTSSSRRRAPTEQTIGLLRFAKEAFYQRPLGHSRVYFREAYFSTIIGGSRDLNLVFRAGHWLLRVLER
jgi:hypothetical protein